MLKLCISGSNSERFTLSGDRCKRRIREAMQDHRANVEEGSGETLRSHHPVAPDACRVSVSASSLPGEGAASSQAAAAHFTPGEETDTHRLPPLSV